MITVVSGAHLDVWFYILYSYDKKIPKVAWASKRLETFTLCYKFIRLTFLYYIFGICMECTVGS